MRDWRDERIAEQEAALAARDAQLAARDAQLEARDARITELEQRVAEVSARLTELAEKLGQNSRNSHRPPSSDPPAARGQRRGKGKSKSQRKRGAQPGHRPASAGCYRPKTSTKSSTSSRRIVKAARSLCPKFRIPTRCAFRSPR